MTKANKSPTSKGMRAKTFFALLVLGTVISAAGIGYAIGAGIGSGTTSTVYKPGTYNLNIQSSSPIQVNSIFIQWNLNDIAMNMTNTSSSSVTDQISITILNGTKTLPTGFFISTFAPNQANLIQAYAVVPNMLTLVPGSMITIGA